MSRYVALVRGINVGGNAKVPMPLLKQIFVDLGCTEVSTLINSGNVVFTATGAPSAATIEKRIAEETGVAPRVQVLDASTLRRIADAMPFDQENESRLIISFMGSVPTVDVPDDIEPELIHFGTEAVYQWLPEGVSQSKLKPAFWKKFPPETTARNYRTVKKLIALL